jgi:hypothetical protein
MVVLPNIYSADNEAADGWLASLGEDGDAARARVPA